MIPAYIDKDYMTNDYGLTDFADVEKADYFIKRASRKISLLITALEFNPSDAKLENLAEFQREAIKEATAIYADYYWKMDFDFTEGSISVSVGGQSFSENKVYNGEKYIPQVLEILQSASLLEVSMGNGMAITTEPDPENETTDRIDSKYKDEADKYFPPDENDYRTISDKHFNK